jgi:hypothetical protein
MTLGLLSLVVIGGIVIVALVIASCAASNKSQSGNNFANRHTPHRPVHQRKGTAEDLSGQRVLPLPPAPLFTPIPGCSRPRSAAAFRARY